MKLNRIIKTIFLLEFVKALAIAIKEIFKSKKTINLNRELSILFWNVAK